MKSETGKARPPPRPGGGVWLGAVFHVVATLVLFGFAVLKEEADFWRNSGGWPVWFRDLVRVTFHPLVFMEGFLLVVYSIALLAAGRATLRRRVVVLLLWILLLGAAGYSVADNVQEFIGSLFPGGSAATGAGVSGEPSPI